MAHESLDNGQKLGYEFENGCIPMHCD